ncbi:MAG: hypothetical protein E6K06_05620, partial [Methanobacteriota archaeon]
MEVPPGRVERIADGGPEAIRAILAELRAMKFNGLLKTSVFRGDTPSQGVLVLRGGDGVLAEHRSQVDVSGQAALQEILKDAASAQAQLEIRTYDYGHSSISIDHLQRSNPDAAVNGIGDTDEVLARAAALEAADQEAYRKSLEAHQDQEHELIGHEEELYRRKWELEQEYQRSAKRERALESLRTELQAVKEASTMIMARLEERRTSQDVEVESQKRLLAIELEKARAELDGQRRGFSEREARIADSEREFRAREASSQERDASLDTRESSLDRERKQMNDLYANLQTEMEKISEARQGFESRIRDAEDRERGLTAREQALREWEDKLRDRDGSLSERESSLKVRETSLSTRSNELDAREEKAATEVKQLEKHAEALQVEDASLDGRREELTRATKRMQSLTRDLATKDRKIGAVEREARERQVDLRRRQRELATQGKELERKQR